MPLVKAVSNSDLLSRNYPEIPEGIFPVALEEGNCTWRVKEETAAIAMSATASS